MHEIGTNGTLRCLDAATMPREKDLVVTVKEFFQ